MGAWWLPATEMQCGSGVGRPRVARRGCWPSPCSRGRRERYGGVLGSVLGHGTRRWWWCVRVLNPEAFLLPHILQQAFAAMYTSLLVQITLYDEDYLWYIIVMWSYAHVRSCVHQDLLHWPAGMLWQYEGDHGVDYAAILSVHSHVIVLFKPLSAPLSSAIWAWRLDGVEDFGRLNLVLIQTKSLLFHFRCLTSIKTSLNAGLPLQQQ